MVVARSVLVIGTGRLVSIRAAATPDLRVLQRVSTLRGEGGTVAVATIAGSLPPRPADPGLVAGQPKSVRRTCRRMSVAARRGKLGTLLAAPRSWAPCDRTCAGQPRSK